MKIKILYIVYIFLLLTGSTKYHAQACCTAGTPLLGSLDLTSAPKGILQFGITFDHNLLTDVLNGTRFLENEERERISQSMLLEINYGISNRFSVTALFSYIRQQRTIFNNSSENELTASGLGDIVLMTKYNILPFSIFNNNELSLGLGVKIPTGNSNLRINNILIPADMQPGSGAIDGIFWGTYTKREFFFNNLTFITNVSYRLNGNNDRFGNSNDGYSFGNELIGILGLNYPLSSIFDLLISFKYRNTAKDSFSDEDIPNTGGSWLYLKPNFNIYLTNDFTARIGAEFPINRNVSGTQLTTTYSTSLSLFYSTNLFEGSFK